MNTVRSCAFICCALLFLLAPQRSVAQRDAWIATWTASPEPGVPFPGLPVLNLQDQTVRERVRISVGGSQIRIRLSNEYGSSPLVLDSVTVAAPSDLASVKSGSILPVTFGGRNSITIPAGAPAISDPVAFPVDFGAEISVSLHFPQRVTTPTWHSQALKRAVVSPQGDHTHDGKIEGGTETLRLVVLSAVLVPEPPSHRVVVAFGDSIVDGHGSSVEADRDWPSDLIRRLGKTPAGSKWAVVNEGIGGNRLLAEHIASLGVSALTRFDRDALSVPGVTHIVLAEGLNDIGMPGAKLGDVSLADPAEVRTADDLIGAYRQLIARAHARGVKLIGCTLTPIEGGDIPGFYSDAKEATRQAVNKWIRTSGAFDGVIDFDAVVRDPDHPGRLLPRFA